MEEQQTPRPNKNKIFLIAGIAVAAALLITFGFIFLNKEKPNPPVNPGRKLKDSARVQKKDSVIKVKDSVSTPGYRESEDEEESPYSEYRVIASTVTLSSGKLKFGDKVFADDRKSDADHKIILLQNPYQHPDAAKYKVDANFFIEDHRFDEYKNNFSLAPFSSLSSGVKNILLNENYSDGNKYMITQNKERAKSSVTFGDFDGDGIRDVAVLMDNNEKQISRLLIICSNEVTKRPYIAFAENYADKMKVSLDTTDYVPVVPNSIIVSGENAKLSIVYDTESQKFKTYYLE